MKRQLAILSFAFSAIITGLIVSLHATDLPAPAPGGAKDYTISNEATYTVTSSGTLANNLTVLTRQFLMMGEHGAEIMTINGVPVTEPPPRKELPKDDPNHLAFYDAMPVFHRPEKPEQIKVTIHTADGKAWRAVWEPDK